MLTWENSLRTEGVPKIMLKFTEHLDKMEERKSNVDLTILSLMTLVLNPLTVLYAIVRLVNG